MGKIIQFPKRGIYGDYDRPPEPDPAIVANLERPGWILLAYRTMQYRESLIVTAYWMPETGPRWVWRNESDNWKTMEPGDRISRWRASRQLTGMDQHWRDDAVILAGELFSECSIDFRYKFINATGIKEN